MADTRKLIYLVPSGDTSWQDQDRVQGNTDLPLSEQGQRQASAMAASAVLEGAGVVYCSPDEASRQTAAVLAETMGAKVKAVDELIEMNLGLWQGLTEEELSDRFRSTYSHWRTDPGSVSVPQGEPLEDVLERLETATVKLIGKTGAEPLVLVLRPVMLGLCGEWLREAAVNEKHGAGEANEASETTPRDAGRMDAPVIRCFELDEPRWRNPRALRRKKRMSA